MKFYTVLISHKRIQFWRGYWKFFWHLHIRIGLFIIYFTGIMLFWEGECLLFYCISFDRKISNKKIIDIFGIWLHFWRHDKFRNLCNASFLFLKVDILCIFNIGIKKIYSDWYSHKSSFLLFFFFFELSHLPSSFFFIPFSFFVFKL